VQDELRVAIGCARPEPAVAVAAGADVAVGVGRPQASEREVRRVATGGVGRAKPVSPRIEEVVGGVARPQPRGLQDHGVAGGVARPLPL
jgi:hypothetical protein